MLVGEQPGDQEDLAGVPFVGPAGRILDRALKEAGSFYAGVVFSLLTFFVAVPSAIKVFNWTVSLHKGSIGFDAPMIYALGFVLLFTLGGVTGLMVATLAWTSTCSF